MTALVLSLPVPLILLVHLHILEYPLANKPEYDHNIFNAQVRGLRDRIKTLEDVCYFLVGRLEGNARMVCHVTESKMRRDYLQAADPANLSLCTTLGYCCLPYLTC